MKSVRHRPVFRCAWQCLLPLLFSVAGYAQDFSINDYTLFPGTNSISVSRVHRVALDVDSELFVVTFSTEGVDLDPGPAIFQPVNMRERLLKLSASNELLAVWEAPGFRIANVELGPDGEVYITGGNTTAQSIDLDPGPGVWLLAPSYSLVVIKFSNDLDLIWGREVLSASASCVGSDDQIGPMERGGRSLTVLPDGGVAFVGQFCTSSVDMDPGVGSYTPYSQMSFAQGTYLIRLDSGGVFQWAQPVQRGLFSSVTSDAAGNVYGLLSFGSLGDETLYLDVNDSSIVESFSEAENGNHALVIAYDQMGGYKWHRRLSDVIQLGRLTMASDGSLFVTINQVLPGADLDPGPDMFTIDHTGYSDNSVHVLRMDTTGSFISAWALLATIFSSVSDILFVDGHTVLSGHFAGTADLDPSTGVMLASNNNLRGFLIEILPDGALGLRRVISSSVLSQIDGVAMRDDRLIAVGFYRGNYNFSGSQVTSMPLSGDNGFILDMTYAPVNTQLSEQDPYASTIGLLLTPEDRLLDLSRVVPKASGVAIFDMSGRQLQTSWSSVGTKLDLSPMAPGHYILRISGVVGNTLARLVVR